MPPKLWRIRLGRIAEQNFDAILIASAARFGELQARAYQTLLIEALAALEKGPNVLGNLRRNDILPGFRNLHAARWSHRARHLLLYHAIDGTTIDVIHILRDRTDILRHLPLDSE